MENYLTFSLTVFAGLFATIDPLGNLPLFISLTDGASDKVKSQISLKSTLYGFLILLCFILFGKSIFEAFQITIPAFKIAGGLLLFYIGFEMVFPKQHTNGTTERDAQYFHNIAISPLAIPLIAGPSSIVAAMNFVADSNYWYMIITVIGCLLICILTYVIFLSSKYLVRILGINIIGVISRLMGLILTILAVDMVIGGIKLAF